jgi:hypothetical protein
MAQEHCRVRYSYNASGDRVSRDWHCWTGDLEPPPKMNSIANTQMGVRPNPANEELHISLPEEFATGKLELLNSYGALVAQQAVQGTLSILDVRALPAGAYFLRFQHGSEWIITSCIIE